MAIWNTERMIPEETILDEIRTKINNSFINTSIYILPDCKDIPQLIFLNDYVAVSPRIVVGEKWFTDEQWAKLMVMRLNGDIVFEKQEDGSLLINEKNVFKWYTGGYVQPQPVIQRPIWLDDNSSSGKHYTHTYTTSGVTAGQPVFWGNIHA